MHGIIAPRAQILLNPSEDHETAGPSQLVYEGIATQVAEAIIPFLRNPNSGKYCTRFLSSKGGKARLLGVKEARLMC